ncbi:hypothetical protein GKE82_11450 [Conexibacter sp. W3-3-2]|uniref:hypothetical protein n=1 Tax=Conexibacter sp. W3-3-2 TaxID=2675227 RepID=UPI0012B7FCCC|nr:hypothetical protein [Conexibacter sp. W3-3-2]MTD44890.1 hypothetical protein [Conexibacter sp. W3-3-2]
MEDLAGDPSAALDETLEEAYLTLTSVNLDPRSPTDWLAALVDAVGAFAAGPTEDSRELLMRIAAVGCGAMDAHSIPANPGTPADPAVLLALTFHEATALIRERGWVAGDRGVWIGRLAGAVGEYAVIVVAWHENEANARPLEFAGPAAMAVTATALLAAAALGARGG